MGQEKRLLVFELEALFVSLERELGLVQGLRLLIHGERLLQGCKLIGAILLLGLVLVVLLQIHVINIELFLDLMVR